MHLSIEEPMTKRKKNTTLKDVWLVVVLGWVTFWKVPHRACECGQNILERLIVVCRATCQLLLVAPPAYGGVGVLHGTR